MEKYIFGLFFFLFLSIPTLSFARMLPQVKTTGKQATIRSAGNNISVSARLRRDRHALTVSFSNLYVAASVSYTLIYQTGGHEEGAGGSIREDEGNYATRELLFGTCSSGVCRYHTNITNMSLEVTGQLKSGKTFTKRFRIKI